MAAKEKIIMFFGEWKKRGKCRERNVWPQTDREEGGGSKQKMLKGVGGGKQKMLSGEGEGRGKGDKVTINIDE